MNALFIGVGGALILALFTALVGPHLVDWTTQRAWIERETAQVLGVPVSIQGPIDLAILPAPVIHLEKVDLGKPGAATGPDLTVGRITLNLSPTAFLQGEVRVNEVLVDGAVLDAEVRADGSLALPLEVPVDAAADRTILERVVVSDSRLRVRDRRSGAETVVEGIGFTGEARSLAGPYKADGRFRLAGVEHGFRLSTTRLDSSGLRMKASVTPSDRPLTVEYDGAASLGPQPGLDGRLVATRAAVEGDAEARPWRFEAQVKATPAEVALERVELSYGAEDRRAVLTGTARRRFAPSPALTVALAGRQVDLDRLFGAGEDLTLAAKVGRLLGSAPALGRPPENTAVTLDVAGVVLGGGAISNVHVDVAARPNGWAIRAAEAVLPGSSLFRFEGDLSLAPDAEELAGTVSLQSAAFSTMRNWLAGPDQDLSGLTLAPGRLEARTRLRLARDVLVLDDLSLGLGEASLAGRIALGPAPGRSGRKLDVALRAARLDVDRLLPPETRRLVYAGLPGWPYGVSDATVRLDAEALTLEGVRSEGVSAVLRLAGGTLAVDRLSIDRLGGASLEVAGRVQGTFEAPEGQLTVGAKADDLGGVARILSAAEPTRALGEALGRRRAALAPLDVNASLDFRRGRDGTGGRIALGGSAGGSAMSANLSLQGLGSEATAGGIEGAVSLENPSAARLLAQLGLASGLEGSEGRGALELTAKGPLRGDVEVAARLEALSSSLSARGAVRPFAQAGQRSRLSLRADSPDLAALGPALGLDATLGGGGLPLTLLAQLSGAGDAWTLHDLSAELAGARLTGRLDLVLGSRPRVDGDIATSDLDLEAIAAFGLGGDLRGDGEAAWSDLAFARSPLGGLDGEVRLVAERAALLPGAALAGARMRLVLSEAAIALRDVEGSFAGGRVAGALEIGAADGIRRVSLRSRLEGARAEDVVWRAGGSSVLKGRLGLTLDLQGEGRSPLALLSQSGGGGSLLLENAEIRGLGPQAFAALVRAADAGTALEEPALAKVAEAQLAAGTLSVPRAEGALSINGGVVRLGNFALEGEAATALASGRVDLSSLGLEGTVGLSLRGPLEEGAAPPPPITIAFRGPVDEPARDLDLGDVLGFLTARALDQELARLDALEAEIAERERMNRELTRLAQERRRREREAEEARRRAEDARRQAEQEAARRASDEQRRREDEAARLEAERLLTTPPEGTASLPTPQLPGEPTRLVPPDPGAAARGVPPRAPAPQTPQQRFVPAPLRPRAASPLPVEPPLIDRLGEALRRP